MNVDVLKTFSCLSMASAAAMALAGCTLGPNFARPTPPGVTQYTAEPTPEQTTSAEIAGGDAQRFIKDMDVSGQWWTQFGSDALNGLVDQALKSNSDIEAAQAALRQFEQNFRASEGALYPQVNGSGFVEREGDATGTPFNVYNATVNVSYAVDVFGGIRRTIEASAAQTENQRFQLEATYLTLISNVITTAILTASLSAQIAATQDIIAAQSQELDLLNQQFELGAVARGDVLQQQSQLASTQASLPPLQKQLTQARNLLSVLLGRTPSEIMIPNLELVDLKLPPELPLTVPSKLVEQRPDIRASEALLHQASAQVGIATAAQFPSFSLTGAIDSVTNSRAGSPGFLTPDSFAWSIAANVAAPIFRGGTLEAQKEAAVFNYDKVNAQYRGVVLNAFANVANVLTALQLDAETLRVQLYAEQTAEQSLEITQERFQAGAIAYLSLLDAQRTYQQARIALVIAQANRYADTVALFQALGGGWWNRQDVIQASDKQASDTSPPTP
jgi:NodT family efflux transporter outer membrane factor (OMF) lipoprotein